MKKKNFFGKWVVIGLAIGVAIGVATKNIPMGGGIGVLVGFAIGMLAKIKNKKGKTNDNK
ncbi:MAG: hypothetical protein ABSD71_14510 [Bacteroidales bacterium]